MTPTSPSRALALAASLLIPLAAARADDTDALLQRLLAQTQEIENSGTAAQPESARPENTEAAYKQLFENLRAQTAALNELTNLGENEPAASSNQPAPAASTGTRARTPSIQPGRLESSGSLNGAHLPGYPALPDVAPTSSILEPTAAQLQHDRDVDAAIAERKLFHQQNPAPSR